MAYYLAMSVHAAGRRTASLVAVIAALALTLLVPAAPVAAAPQITLTPDSGSVGTRVTLSGVNFDSYRSDSLSVFFAGTEIASSPVTVSDSGGFEALFDVPDDAAPGQARLWVQGPLGATLAEAYFTVVATRIGLDVDTGPVGSAVTVVGVGFHAESIVTFSFSYDGVTQKLGTTVASPIGELRFAFTVPPSTAGAQRVVAVDGRDNAAAAVFGVLPLLALRSTTGSVGQGVTAAGTGFAGTDRVTLYFDTAVVTIAATSPAGGFEAAFDVPLVPGGVHAVRANDAAGNASRVDFTVIPKSVLDRTTGHVGMSVTVSGNGYAAGATITVRYGDAQVATAHTDALGVFSTEFQVPVSASGLHSIPVSDGQVDMLLVFSMESAAPPAPALLAPEADAEAASPVMFLWRTVDDASLPVTYGIEVSADAGFTDLLLDASGLSSPTYTASAEEEWPAGHRPVPLYWRVRATDAASNVGPWSATGAFHLPSPGGLPPWAIGVLAAAGVAILGLLTLRIVREMSFR